MSASLGEQPARQPALVKVKRLSAHGTIPRKAYDGDAAYDLYAAEEHTLAPLGRALVGTGVALELPPGTCALTVPRSGLAIEHGISIVNAPGLIDSGYRGEVRVILLNTDAHSSFTVAVGDRVAQLLIVTLSAIELREVTTLSDTNRGSRGFGSSGL